MPLYRLSQILRSLTAVFPAQGLRTITIRTKQGKESKESGESRPNVGGLRETNTRSMLLNNRLRVSGNYSNLIAAWCFLLYMAAVLTLKAPCSYRLKQIAHILSPFWLLYPIQAHRFIVHVVPFSLIFFLKRIIKQILFSPCKRDIPARTGTLVHLSVPRLFFPASATGPPKAPESHAIPDSETWFPRFPSAPGTVLMIRSCKVQRMGKKIS